MYYSHYYIFFVIVVHFVFNSARQAWHQQRERIGGLFCVVIQHRITEGDLIKLYVSGSDHRSDIRWSAVWKARPEEPAARGGLCDWQRHPHRASRRGHLLPWKLVIWKLFMRVATFHPVCRNDNFDKSLLGVVGAKRFCMKSSSRSAKPTKPKKSRTPSNRRLKPK